MTAPARFVLPAVLALPAQPLLPIVPDAEWARLLAVYAATAQAQPEHNCSVPGNPRAARFAPLTVACAAGAGQSDVYGVYDVRAAETAG